jgi:uncharacterized protein
MRPTVAELAATLGLEPHTEGGYFRETFRSAETLQTPRGERAASTAILFLVTAAAISRLHRLSSDELWVFQGGLPLELTTISPDGAAWTILLGDPAEAVEAGQAAETLPRGGATTSLVPQALVPAGSWQGARLAGGPSLPTDRAWALVSCVVTPGFAYADFELADRAALLAAFPRHRELVEALT